MSERESLRDARVKRIVGHRAECWFRDNENPEQFYAQGAPIYRDALGRKGNTTWTWDTYVCNDPDCPGTVAVRADFLAAKIAEALEARMHD
jgi:hypothetical protein